MKLKSKPVKLQQNSIETEPHLAETEASVEEGSKMETNSKEWKTYTNPCEKQE